MIFRPQFKRSFRCEVIPSEGVFLLSEGEQSLLCDSMSLQIAPFLDKQLYTDEEIVDQLKGKNSAAEVFYILDLLRERGYVVEAAPEVSPEQAAFWDALDIPPQEAFQHLQETSVSIISYGAIDPSPFQQILASSGIHVGNEGSLQIVVATDYLTEDLADFNQQALRENSPWMLVKPIGRDLWIGPLFLPGKTGCWACLAHRLRGTRKTEYYLQDRLSSSSSFSPPPAFLSSTLQTAFNLAVTEIATWIARGQNEKIEGQLLTFNTHSFKTQSHPVVRRPQCPHCGGSQAYRQDQEAPIVLQSRKKLWKTGNKNYTLPPEETMKKLEHHISPITGIVQSLQPVSRNTNEDQVELFYIATHNFIHATKDYASGLDYLYSLLQDSSAGKGQETAQAKASALCEAIERYSGVFQGDEARLRATFKNLEGAVHPNDCMLYSEQQLLNREKQGTFDSPAIWVPEPFDEDKEIEWSPVWSLASDESRHVPTAYCYYGYSRKYQSWFARADSNGCAAGHTKEEAILHGFLELVERDSVALWWYNQLPKPQVDLSSFDDPYLEDLKIYYQTLHRDFWVLDLTSDLNIPTFVAVSRRNDQETEDIIFGFGAHLDAHVAVLQALTEMGQSLPDLVSGTPDNGTSALQHDPDTVAWWQNATIEHHPYLRPDEALPAKVLACYPQQSSDDFRTDVLTCVQVAKDRGLETLILDQTRPDTGLHVVKVIVPGLRHFWARFAPGRLYEVPVQMGMAVVSAYRGAA